MLSDADYKELKAQQKNLNPEGRAALREYELSNPQHADMGPTGAEKLAENEPKGSSLEGPQVGQIPKDAGVNVPALPPEGAPPKLGPQSPDSLRLDQYQQQLNASTPGQDQTRDNYLPNASKLKTLAAPPEYVSKNPAAGIKHVIGATLMDPFEGPGVGVYHEPTEKQFQADMGPVLEAKGIAPGHREYDAAFNEYKDRKWVQAYQKAQATDTPLTRIAYVDHSGAWAQLKDALQEFPDVASSFAKGFASGGTLHATEAIETPQDTEQSERDPIARGAGELAGAMNPGSLLARGAGAVGGVASKLLPGGILSRLGIGAAVGAGAGATDLAGKEAARAVREGSPTAAKDEFLRSLPGAVGMGAGFGLGGTLAAEGANKYQRWAMDSAPELGQGRRGGVETSAIFGVTPGPEVGANIEAAREPAIGEDKPPPAGMTYPVNPSELAANKVQGPLAEANIRAHTDIPARVAAEKEAAVAADPKLAQPVQMHNSANAAVDWLLSELQPKAAEGFLPGITPVTKGDVAPAGDVSAIKELLPQLVTPRLVTASEASGEATRRVGKVLTIDEARKVGLDVNSLIKGQGLKVKTLEEARGAVDASRPRVPGSAGYDSQGVPRGAPPIEDAEGTAERVGAPATAKDIFGEPAEKPTPRPGTDLLKPREGKAFRTPEAPPAEGGDPFGTEAKRTEKTALNLHQYEVADPFADRRSSAGEKSLVSGATRPSPPSGPAPVSATPSGPPAELRTPPASRTSGAYPSAPMAGPLRQVPVAGPLQQQVTINGIPESEYRVVVEPNGYNAQKMEGIISDIDRRAGEGARHGGKPDPNWQKMQAAAREDRDQFGKPWTDMIAEHHKLLNSVEQTSGHAGLTEKKPYAEMSANGQKAFNSNLVKFPGGDESQNALRRLAEQAGPGVQHDLEVLGAQNAYAALKGQAAPKIGVAVSPSGWSDHLRGFGPAVKLRADAVARGISAGPTGEPTITPRLVNFVRQNAPKSKFLPGLTAMGQGALGLKAGSVYNSTRDRGDLAQSLTPSEKQFLEQLLSATQEAP